MSNYIELKKELINYILARTPLIIINSIERERVERILREIVVEKQFSLQYYTDSKQVKNLNNATEAHDAQGDPLGYFLNLLKRQRGCTIALGDVKRISDDNVYSRELLNILYMAKENNGVTILITPDHVWTRLNNFGMIATLDLPDISERITQIQKFINIYSGRFEIDWNSEDICKAATVLRGFSEIQIENILSTEIIGNNGLQKDKIYQLADQKQKLYARVSSVQHIILTKKQKVSGMENLKKWLTEKKKIFFMPEDILAQYDLGSPKGILLVGVPGCGKSLSAKLIAQEWELPLFRFDVGSIFDKWVGESEKKMREALQFIDNVSPCVLWIDEIEKVLATSDAGNETGKRVLGEFLFWLQESKSKVFMVATANNVQALPYELYRKGRFSEVFYAGLPNELERQEAIKQYMEISLKFEPEDKLLEELVSETEGYSYSDIENAIKEIAQKALIYSSKSVCSQDLIESVRRIIPISQINPKMIESIEKWGRERAINISIQ